MGFVVLRNMLWIFHLSQRTIRSYFTPKYGLLFFFLFEENFLWSKQSSHLLTVNQSAVSVSVATGTYKRRETRCKSHLALAIDVNTCTKHVICLSVLLKMSVYYPTQEGQNNPYNDFSAQISISTNYKSIDHSKLLSVFFF